MQKEQIKKERTLVIIKPDGVQRTLIGEVIKRYERVGLKIVGMKMLLPDRNLIESHYTIDPDWIRKAGEKSIKNAATDSVDPIEVGKQILEQLVYYFSASPVVAMVLEGAHAVDVVRKITGGTEPRSSDVGTIRGDFMLDSYVFANGEKRAIRNIVHASGSIEESSAEIPLWFKENELISYRLVQEGITYDVNLDGLLE